MLGFRVPSTPLFSGYHVDPLLKRFGIYHGKPVVFPKNTLKKAGILSRGYVQALRSPSIGLDRDWKPWRRGYMGNPLHFHQTTTNIGSRNVYFFLWAEQKKPKLPEMVAFLLVSLETDQTMCTSKSTHPSREWGSYGCQPCICHTLLYRGPLKRKMVLQEPMCRSYVWFWEGRVSTASFVAQLSVQDW